MCAIRASFNPNLAKACVQLSEAATSPTEPLKTPLLAQRTLNASSIPYLSPPIKPERFKVLTQNDYAIFFNGDQVLKHEEKNSFIIPCTDVYKNPDQVVHEKDYFYIGEYENKKIFGASYNSLEETDKFVLTPARDALAMTDAKTSHLVCRAKHLLNWHRSSLYSGCCGVPTTLSPTEIAKICENCKKTIYPTTSSFVIVLIEKNGKLLLARSPHFAKGMYSTLAGFVDAGESYEDAVHREVKEEVGIKVKDLTYFGSQSWPFPSSIAVAFKAKHAEGDIQMDPTEIEDAQWFDPKELPPLPHPCSISRHIIDDHTKHL
jgi:NAD+ diphosphatase